MVGGYTEDKQSDETSQNLLNHHQNDIQTQLGIQYNNAQVVSYQTQVVAGTNYKIKAKTDDGKTFEVTIYKKLPHDGQVTSVTKAELV